MMFVSKRCNLRSRKTHFFTADFLRLLVRKNPRQLKQGMSFFRRNSIAITHHKILKSRFVHRVNQTVRLFKQCFIRHFPPPFTALKTNYSMRNYKPQSLSRRRFRNGLLLYARLALLPSFLQKLAPGSPLQSCNRLLLRWRSHCVFATASFYVREFHCAFATPSFCVRKVIAVLQWASFVLGKSLQFCNARPLCEGGYCHSSLLLRLPPVNVNGNVQPFSLAFAIS